MDKLELRLGGGSKLELAPHSMDDNVAVLHASTHNNHLLVMLYKHDVARVANWCRSFISADEARVPAPTSVVNDMLELIEKHGANATILALAEALELLGPEWRGENGPAAGVECVTGYSPHHEDDWKSRADAVLKEWAAEIRAAAR